jgi:phosphoribosylformylglycinamidine synthase subunit PurQ / glutaminase
MNLPALVLTAPGTNRDRDVADALAHAGASPRIAALAEVAADPSQIAAARLLVVAGGFSHADALGAGRMFALDLEHRLGDHLRAFVHLGHPVIGICNGFQVLTRTGLLPGALGHNDTGRFVCRWVHLDTPPSRCVWTSGLVGVDCPIAHGEGRYVHPDPVGLAAHGQVALRYAGANPNGSVGEIAGVCDEQGTTLGLMPHPENHIVPRQFPGHVRGHKGLSGVAIFDNGVRYARGL